MSPGAISDARAIMLGIRHLVLSEFAEFEYDHKCLTSFKLFFWTAFVSDDVCRGATSS
jgi:hypothetical protein